MKPLVQGGELPSWRGQPQMEQKKESYMSRLRQIAFYGKGGIGKVDDVPRSPPLSTSGKESSSSAAATKPTPPA
ncbi:hypothetical protein X759_35390 [Mesorhizobium sp. LSHC420B00]|nr:hypothetical protein X759_35390 [Mesorhizobium sp. LSHC420B00]